MVGSRLVFQMLGLAAEIGFLHLRASEIGLDQIVLGQKIAVLQAQRFFHAAGVGVGLDTEGHHAGFA
ncbi:hypothetical protein D3C80_439580 [compost metagenome]